MDFHINPLVVELELGTVEPEVLCVHKLRQPWSGECELRDSEQREVM